MNFKIIPLSKHPIWAVPYIVFHVLGLKAKQIYLQQNIVLLFKIFAVSTFFSYTVQFRMILSVFLLIYTSKVFPFLFQFMYFD